MTDRTEFSIGDIVPIPADADLHLAKGIQAKRGIMARNAGHAGAMGRVARKILGGQAENRAREANPVEQAKNHLRRRGFIPVYEAPGCFVVGSHRFDGREALFEFARAKGWEG